MESAGQMKVNRNGGEYCNGKALSQDKREKIVEKWLGGQNVTSIAKDLKITHGVVSKIVRQYKATKSVLPKTRSSTSLKSKIKKTPKIGFSMEEILAPTPPQQRAMFSKYQIEVLTDFYDRNKYPSEEEKKTLSIETGLNIEQVTTWFNNRRCRVKKRLSKSSSTSDSRPNSTVSITSIGSLTSTGTEGDQVQVTSGGQEGQRGQEGQGGQGGQGGQVESYPQMPVLQNTHKRCIGTDYNLRIRLAVGGFPCGQLLSSVMFRSILKQSSAVLRAEYRFFSSDYASKFAAAQTDLKKLKEAPDNDVKLKLYALFKQGTSGDVSGSQPSMLNFVERAKYDAWASVKGLSNEEAQKQYVELVNGLLGEEAGSGSETSAPSSEGVDGLRVTVENGVLQIELNRPKKFNAITPEMYEAMTKILYEADENKNVKVIVFTGVGDYYSSGNDLGNFALVAKYGKKKLADMTYEVYLKFVNAFIDVQKPLIALVNGPAVGITVTTLPFFSLVLASEKATFNAPFATIGQCAEGCSTFTFPMLMGNIKASEILIFGRKLTAQEAYERNLVTAVLPAASFREEANKRVAEIARLPPNTMKMNATVMKDVHRETLKRVAVHEAKNLKASWLSKECEEAVMNFMSRKK